MNTSLIAIGQITTTRGIKGEVKAFIYDGNPKQRLAAIKSLFLESPDNLIRIPVTLESYWLQKGTVIIKFAEFNSPDEVERYRRYYLSVPESECKRLAADEYFWHDLIGSRVLDQENGYIGTVSDIHETGAHDILVVLHGDQEILIPFVEVFITSVDIADKVIIISSIPGLIDDFTH